MIQLLPKEIEQLQQLLNTDLNRFHSHFISKIVFEHQQSIKINNFEYYLHTIKTNPNEHEKLKKSLCVSYSRFFRNAVIFELIDYVLFPRIFQEKQKKSGTIKIWSAGCAGGEEPYSIAILLSELMRRNSFINTCIMASDANPEIETNARKGIYTRESVKNAKQYILQNYFKPVGNNYQISDKITKMVDFVNHDLCSDEMFDHNKKIQGNFDIIFCRNVLIYFNQEKQIQLVEKLHSLIEPGGYLVLGRTEYIPGDICFSFKKVLDSFPVYQKIK